MHHIKANLLTFDPVHLFWDLLSLSHEIIIEEPLSFGEPATDHMLVLLRKLLLYLTLQSAQ